MFSDSDGLQTSLSTLSWFMISFFAASRRAACVCIAAAPMASLPRRSSALSMSWARGIQPGWLCSSFPWSPMSSSAIAFLSFRKPKKERERSRRCLAISRPWLPGELLRPDMLDGSAVGGTMVTDCCGVRGKPSAERSGICIGIEGEIPGMTDGIIWAGLDAAAMSGDALRRRPA